MILPFHTTVSEARIISELLAIAKRRGSAVPPTDQAQNAGKYIEILEESLFPHTRALVARRADLVGELNTTFSHVNFDRNLESAEIKLQATIKNESDYQDLVRRLQNFDFGAWVRHCAAERQHAD
jgi:recombinational DNA repair ATPase RecF